MDYEADKEIPIILGRPFLATRKTLIDEQKGELTMRMNDQKVVFNILSSLKYPDDPKECNMVARIDVCSPQEILSNAFSPTKEGNEEDQERENCILPQHEEVTHMLDLEGIVPTLPSIMQPPALELKPLPTHLKYKFLGETESLPVIISSKLDSSQEHLLMEVLARHKKAIGWSLADIKGISPSYCMHKIRLIDESNEFVERQRRL
ncbi:MAG: hypothetical protein Q8836_02575, partial [Sweet potato little leaf phytoplasma]|nr:hypothetical protein [Sweet potato little leaf phytoplasma]